ncbi:MAG: hypothetical protein M1470_06120 [Bacteroidetes bacterium]|nr:hypothetical protein [Bacteroidota bacterium]MCL5738286.1 hypothetical protein [Bacteroidota bacterium]
MSTNPTSAESISRRQGTKSLNIASPHPIPSKLFSNCYSLVQVTHAKFGLLALDSRLATKESLVAIALMERTREAMVNAGAEYKLRIILVFADIAVIVTAFVFSWWIVLLLPILLVTQRGTKVNELNHRFYASASLLSLEVLANDFAGWGTAYPEERARAVAILGGEPIPPTTWLDLYLARRDQVPPSEQKKSFGP